MDWQAKGLGFRALGSYVALSLAGESGAGTWLCKTYLNPKSM